MSCILLARSCLSPGGGRLDLELLAVTALQRQRRGDATKLRIFISRGLEGPPANMARTLFSSRDSLPPSPRGFAIGLKAQKNFLSRGAIVINIGIRWLQHPDLELNIGRGQRVLARSSSPNVK